jgi:uncharacterized protein YegL
MIEFDNNIRRLPVYLLLDCSSSMQGVKIVGLNNGVVLLYQQVMQDPRAADTVYISVITFNDSAYQTDLEPIQQFSPPQMTAQGLTALGAALKLLNDSLDRDIIPNQPGRKGDYKPLVFVLTDGQPNDSWQPEAQRLASRNPHPNVFGLAIGDDADENMLKQVAKAGVLKLKDATPDRISAFFDWVSASVRSASAAAVGGGGQMLTPPPPQGFIAEM